MFGWSGMRGAVSLAAALAIPTTVASGAAFPDRDLILWLVYCVIFVTLVVQGLTLPLLIRALGVSGDAAAEAAVEARARRAAAEAAIARLEELVEEPWVREETAERLRGQYEYRRRRFAARDGDEPNDGYDDRADGYRRLSRQLLEAQRVAIYRMRAGGELHDEATRRIERELDLEHERLEERGAG